MIIVKTLERKSPAPLGTTKHAPALHPCASAPPPPAAPAGPHPQPSSTSTIQCTGFAPSPRRTLRLVFTVAPRSYHLSVQHTPHSRREASLRRVQHKHSHRRARNLALQSTSNHRLAQVVVAAPENGRMSAPPPRTGASINELLAPEQPERHQLAMARHVRKCNPAEVPSCSPCSSRRMHPKSEVPL